MLALVETQPLVLSRAEKLAIVRERDIFHLWGSLDEKRFCQRCGATFSGNEIKVFPGRRAGIPYRLECPTAGCPSVPIEWMMVDSTLKRATTPPEFGFLGFVGST
jgi:hypothetical protein